MEIAEALKYQREIRNLSQSELAKKTKLSQPAISYWEKGINIPSVEYCIILADFYGITLDELVGRDFPPAGTVYYKSAVNNKIGNNSKIEIK